jgi:hypothetical protein
MVTCWYDRRIANRTNPLKLSSVSIIKMATEQQGSPAAGTGAKGFGPLEAGGIAQRSTGAVGFVFEELMDQTLRKLIQPLASKGTSARLLNEQQIRDEFAEQSLNGVDHYFELEGGSLAGPTGILILIQEKWKFVTNQREVSQFLDCCARILARMPTYKGRVMRLWVTRTQPTLNGEKSLTEGGAHVIQSSTSMCFLAQEVGQYICEVLGDRSLATDMVRTMPPLLSGDAPVLDPPAVKTLGEKNVGSAAMNVSKIKVCVVRKE